MDTLPQDDRTAKGTKSFRLREDVWEAARAEAFHGRTSIGRVLDRALRGYFNLQVPGAEPAADNAGRIEGAA
jgi:hypothetical protein